ncbi:MAG: hypothetical protein M1321_03235 [Candidatus Marsarchaeota archaeon]|nr:hypothetical protein [Candidatus Marsarchaeota archaeon]
MSAALNGLERGISLLKGRNRRVGAERAIDTPLSWRAFICCGSGFMWGRDINAPVDAGHKSVALGAAAGPAGSARRERSAATAQQAPYAFSVSREHTSEASEGSPGIGPGSRPQTSPAISLR